MVRFDPLTVLFFVAALLPAIVFHEWSHGIVADRMGDRTPRMAGRLTLNPVRHIDPFGTVILPGLLLLPILFGQGGPIFGYAKPMPVTPQNLREPNRQMMWIAAVGPVSNLLLAMLGALALRFAGGTAVGGPLTDFLFIFVFVNVLLAVFNILPIPPLDGSKVLGRFLPGRAGEVYRSLEPYGALFILAIFFIFRGPVFTFVFAVVDGLIEILV
jgi:Zn-dependent protease